MSHQRKSLRKFSDIDIYSFEENMPPFIIMLFLTFLSIFDEAFFPESIVVITCGCSLCLLTLGVFIYSAICYKFDKRNIFASLCYWKVGFMLSTGLIVVGIIYLTATEDSLPSVIGVCRLGFSVPILILSLAALTFEKWIKKESR